jgi:hypothetical protein
MVELPLGFTLAQFEFSNTFSIASSSSAFERLLRKSAPRSSLRQQLSLSDNGG